MKTLLTLDYEVFFGRESGSVRRSVIEPTEALLRIAGKHGARLVFFVDAGFLLRLRSDMGASARLRYDHADLCRQLEAIARAGHELQLHIHPHWETTRWNEQRGWESDLTHFALQSFPASEIGRIVRTYAAALREIAGPDSAYAYRAGGWVIQPFAPIREALLANEVTIDSTVFAGGVRAGSVQPYDFRGAPAKSRWRFDRDPLREVADGPFLEVPISSRRLGPHFFWRMALAKKAGGARHRAFGDGRAVAMDGGDLASKLLLPSTSVVSLDGYKASFLRTAFDEHHARGAGDFVAIGHPKALTPYSLARLEELLATRQVETHTFAAYRDRTNVKPLERIAA
ncbi:MAG TPA: hypothetical protein VEC19_08425 [Usitatibacter sp.]|nr:hypothetical protein [Usitatibacter sp.]